MNGISVVICCYNSSSRLAETLSHLAKQAVEALSWEVLIIDNNSSDNTSSLAEKEWANHNVPVSLRVIKEEKSGLAFARKRGIEESKHDLLVFCDDDNHLYKNYLQEVVKFFHQYSNVGVVGGKSIPEFEVAPPLYFYGSGISLGCCDKGEELLITSCKKDVKEYPAISPIGSGMSLRKEVGLLYVRRLEKSQITDRIGTSLASGGDNEINLVALINGWEVAYNPRMVLKHKIPEHRTSIQYLSKMAFESSRSWIILLHSFNICPWTPISSCTLPLRILRAFLKIRPWASELRLIRYKGACGIFKGLSELEDK